MKNPNYNDFQNNTLKNKYFNEWTIIQLGSFWKMFFGQNSAENCMQYQMNYKNS